VRAAQRAIQQQPAAHGIPRQKCNYVKGPRLSQYPIGQQRQLRPAYPLLGSTPRTFDTTTRTRYDAKYLYSTSTTNLRTAYQSLLYVVLLKQTTVKFTTNKERPQSGRCQHTDIRMSSPNTPVDSQRLHSPYFNSNLSILRASPVGYKTYTRSTSTANLLSKRVWPLTTALNPSSS
jgi:hypothetical protein